MVNTSNPVTTRRGYRKPGDVDENWESYNFDLVSGMADDIDEDVDNLAQQLGTTETKANDNETAIQDNDQDIAANLASIQALLASVGSIESDLDTVELNQEVLLEEAAFLRTSPTTQNMTYDSEGNISTFETPEYRFYNPVYDSEGNLQTYSEDIKLANKTYNVTLNYNGNGDLESITSNLQV